MFCDECRNFSNVFSETAEVIHRQVEHQIRFHSLPRKPASDQFAVRMEGVEYRFTELDRSALSFGAPQMFIQPRHDLDEVARPCAVVELRGQNAVPAVTAGAGRTRQAENKSGAGDTGGGAALHRGSADLGMAQHVEGDGKTIHPLFEQRVDRFWRHVAAGEKGAAGGDDDIDARIPHPPLYTVAE